MTYSQRDNPAIEAWFARRTAAREAAFFIPYLHRGMQVLDVGCGPGSITLGIFRIPFQPSRPRLTREWAGEKVRFYAERAGIRMAPGLAFHHLRHTARQRLADLGVPVEET